MDRTMLLKHLALVERHVLADVRIIRRQADLVQLMLKQGVDAGGAQELLKQFQEIHTANLADRDRLLVLLQGSPILA